MLSRVFNTILLRSCTLRSQIAVSHTNFKTRCTLLQFRDDPGTSLALIIVRIAESFQDCQISDARDIHLAVAGVHLAESWPRNIKIFTAPGTSVAGVVAQTAEVPLKAP